MTLKRVPGIAAFTLAEAVTLGVWLAIVSNRSSPMSLAAVAGVLLPAGLALARAFDVGVVDGFDDLPLEAVAVASVTEAFVWIAWFGVARALGGLLGAVIAGVLLFTLLVPFHAVENNVHSNRGLFSDLVRRGRLAFTLVETAGATLWLALVLDGDALLAAVGLESNAILDAIPAGPGASLGVAVLALALFVAHVVGTRFALRTGRVPHGL